MKKLCILLLASVLFSSSAYPERRPRDLLADPVPDRDSREKVEAVSEHRGSLTRIQLTSIRVGEPLAIDLGDETLIAEHVSSFSVGNNHVWQGIINGRGSAEFSVSSGRAFGRLTLAKEVWVILPVGDNGNHVVVRDNPGVLKQIDDRSSTSAYKRHSQFQALENIDKKSIIMRPWSGRVSASYGINMGNYADGKIRFNDYAARVLMLDGTEAFEVESLKERRDGMTRLTVRMRNDGIRTAQDLRILVDESGAIVNLVGLVIPNYHLPTLDSLDVQKAAAFGLAVDGLRELLEDPNISMDEVRLESAELAYDSDVDETGREHTSLVWMVNLTHRPSGRRMLQHEARVNAKTRKVSVHRGYLESTGTCEPSQSSPVLADGQKSALQGNDGLCQ